MIAKILPIFVLLAVSHQANLDPPSVEINSPELPQAPELSPQAPPSETPGHPSDKEMPLSGVDPNDTRCEQHGKVFLLLPHHNDCSKFYMCVHGQEVEFSCAPGGLFFDFPLQTCNWAWATKCYLRNPPKDAEGSGEDSFSLEDKSRSEEE